MTRRVNRRTEEWGTNTVGKKQQRRIKEKQIETAATHWDLPTTADTTIVKYSTMSLSMIDTYRRKGMVGLRRLRCESAKKKTPIKTHVREHSPCITDYSERRR
jgi:hypothetical protein